MRHALAGSVLLSLVASVAFMACGSPVDVSPGPKTSSSAEPEPEPIPGPRPTAQERVAACAELEAAMAPIRNDCSAGEPTKQHDHAGDLSDRCEDALEAPDSGWTVAKVQACTDEARATCSRQRRACQELFTAPGLREEGASCYVDEQCASLGCDAKPHACGACRHVPEPGDPCVADGGCGSAMICNGSSVCEAPPAARTLNENAPCDADVECTLGLLCSIFPGESTGKCLPHRAEGAECEGYYDCGPGFGCAYRPSDGRRVCTKKIERGGRCEHTDDQCAGELRCVSLIINAEYTCQKPYGGPGELCSYSLPCAAGNYCPVYKGSESAACEALGTEGAPCKKQGQCVDGLLCDANVCTKTPPATGEACTGICAEGSYCAGDVCAVLPAVGEPCTGYCEAGAFCDAFGSRLCVKERGLGGACIVVADAPSGIECESGYCDGSVCAERPWVNRAIGERCRAQSECAEGACVGSGDEGICTADVAIGAACAAPQGDAIIPSAACDEICEDGVCTRWAEACR